MHYEPGVGRSEDFDLWQRLAQKTRVDNLDKITLKYRVHDKSITSEHTTAMMEQTCEILRRGLNQLGIEVSADELNFHRRAGHGDPVRDLSELKRVGEWFDRIQQANLSFCVHAEDAMRTAMGYSLFIVCVYSARLEPSVWRFSTQS